MFPIKCPKCQNEMKKIKNDIWSCMSCDTKLMEYTDELKLWFKQSLVEKDKKIRKLKSCLKLLGKNVNIELKKSGVHVAKFD